MRWRGRRAASSLVAIIASMWGLWVVSGRRAALVGGVLLASSYTFVADRP